MLLLAIACQERSEPWKQTHSHQLRGVPPPLPPPPARPKSGEPHSHGACPAISPRSPASVCVPACVPASVCVCASVNNSINVLMILWHATWQSERVANAPENPCRAPTQLQHFNERLIAPLWSLAPGRSLGCSNLSISLPIVGNTFHFPAGFPRVPCSMFRVRVRVRRKPQLNKCRQRLECLTLSIKRINFMGLCP